jgi:uncharacterized GH25 family protein
MSRIPTFAIAAAALSAPPAIAHDFWLQPAAFQIAPGAATPLTVQVGDHGQRQRSPIAARRIVRFEAIGPAGRVDLRPALHLGAVAGDADLTFAQPGAYVVALETDAGAVSRQPAARFNAYLADEGLTPALAARRRAGREAAEGTESYSRSAKTIVQAGAAGGADLARPLGLPLEIVLEGSRDPGARAAALPVRVFWKGRPLPGALVKLADLAHDTQPLEARRTDTSGRTRFTPPARGAYRLTVAWTEPLPASAETDFRTVFSSLTFESPP